MVDDKDGSSTASARPRDEYWDRIVSWTAGDEHRRRTVERSRLFDHEAERYDRCRPRYPDVVIDRLLGPEPAGLEVLDVGCGTGIAAVPMAERGAKVLGVELAPRMAEIAHRHGIEVEVGAFEDWDDAGRSFDRVTSAQAWHWLDMPAATAKAASLLRPNGSLGLIWSGGAHPDDLADALEEVYSTMVPPGTHRPSPPPSSHRRHGDSGRQSNATDHAGHPIFASEGRCPGIPDRRGGIVYPVLPFVSADPLLDTDSPLFAGSQSFWPRPARASDCRAGRPPQFPAGVRTTRGISLWVFF